MIAEQALRNAVQAHAAILDQRKGNDARLAAQSQDALAASLADVRDGCSLDDILKVERNIMQGEFDRLATSSPMRGSLTSALEELDQAVEMLPRVRNPEEYALVAATHQHRKHRIGGLPRDDARMFSSAHGARLLNLMKAPLPHTSQAVLSERRRNLRAAEKMYKDLQLRSLGIRAERSDPENALSG